MRRIHQKRTYRIIGFMFCTIIGFLSFPFSGISQDEFTIDPAGHFGGQVECSDVQGDYAYLGQGQHLHVLDVTGAEFQKMGYLQLKGKPLDIFVSGNYAYVYLQKGNGFQIIDISDPNTPFEAGFCDIPGSTDGRLFVSGDYAYLATYNYGLKIVDISYPASPNLITTYDDGRQFGGVFVANDLLYTLHANYNQLVILDVTTPATPAEKSKTNLPSGNKNDIFIKDNYAYIAMASDPDGLLIMDVTDPDNPTEAARFETQVNNEGKSASRVFIEGQTAYVICRGSLWLFIVDISNPLIPTEAGKVDLNDQENPSPRSVHAAAPYVYIGANNTDTPLYQVNATDPTDPTVEKEFFDPYTIYHTYHDGDYLYASSSDEILVYDISTTPDDPILIQRYPISAYILRLFVKDDILYALGTSKLYIIDASNPTQLASLSNTYTFSGNWGNEFFIFDDHAYITLGSSGGSMEIVNVTDPTNPTKAGEHQLPGQGWEIFVKGGSTLAFAVYGTEDADHGFQIIDVSDPANPLVLSTTPTEGQPLCIWVDANTAFIGSNTRNGDDDNFHLEAFDVTNTALPVLMSAVDGSGAIWDVEVEGGYIFTAVQGGTVKGYQYADMILSKIGESSSPSSTGLSVTPPDNSGQSTAYASEGYGYFPLKDATPDEGVVTKTIKGPVEEQGEFTATVRPVADAGTVAPVHASGPVNSAKPVVATAKPGWAFSHWINAAPVDNPVATAILRNPPTVVIAVFNPVLTLTEGPKNPKYQPVCPPMTEDEETNTPIIQVTLTASDADSWGFNTISFRTDGNRTAEDVRTAHLRLNDSAGVKIDSKPFAPTITFAMKAPYNQLNAGESITLMMTYDFKYKEGICTDEKKEFYAWTNRDEIGALPDNHTPGEIQPEPDPLKTVEGGPAVLGCVHNINTEEIFTTIQEAVSDSDTDDGHTILVCPGTYNENVDVDHSLTIRSVKGYEDTWVEGASSSDHVFHVQEKDVSIEGFSIGKAENEGKAGIYLEGSTIRNCIFSENLISDNYIGVYIKNSGFNTMKDNLIFGNNESGIRLEGQGTNNNKVEGNSIGTDDGDSQSFGNIYGIHILDHANMNTIGGISAAQRNTISGNTENGVLIENSGTTKNVVSGNYIGTTGSGEKPLPNKIGIHIRDQAVSNTIGGAAQDCRNVISGNTESGVLIEDSGTERNNIWANFIGTDRNGTKEVENKYGIKIGNSADSNFVGGTSLEKRNVISGNSNIGVFIDGTGTQNNRVTGNYIGTNKTGTDSLKSRYGVWLSGGASSNYIGGKTVSERNIISGNSQAGIFIGMAESNFVMGNYIGTDEKGTGKLPNQYGVYIQSGASLNVIGGYNENERNIISGNSADGIGLIDVESNMVLGNFIGTSKDGDKPLANEKNGITISNGASENWIGTYEGGGNVISGNGSNGILLMEDANKNEILDNYIGTDNTASKAVANEEHGIKMFRKCIENHIGGKVVGEVLQIKGNILSGNKKSGLAIVGYGFGKPTENYVLDNLIGTNKDGTIAIANEEHGIEIVGGANDNWIGSYQGGRNIISGNKKNGVLIKGFETLHNIVIGNYIGTKNSGEERLPNEENGIEIADKARISWIGGARASGKLRLKRNIISGNNKNGIWLHNNGTEHNYILDNYIGTDKSGKKRVENKEYGIKISGQASDNWVGTYEGGGNLISGNRRSGVLITGKATDRNEILDSYIGTNNTGMEALPNDEHGVEISNGPFATRVGGFVFDDLARGNLISGNKMNGVLIKGKSPNNDVMANYIGTNLNLTGKLSNGQNGVEVNGGALSNYIGSFVHHGNVIGGNGQNGIYIVGPRTGSTAILKNFIGTDMDGQKILGNTGYGVSMATGSIRTYVERNNIWCNYGSIKDNGMDSYINGNSIKFNTHNTGIHLDNSTATIVGNDISDDEGDGIICENGSKPIIKKNNIYSNQGYGIDNLDQTTAINAQDNWWGDASGPGGSGPGSGDEINGAVNYDNWRESLVALVVAPWTDTLFIASGQVDSVRCSFINWQNPSDILDVNISESFDWLMSPNNFIINLGDTLRSSVQLRFNVPENSPIGSIDKIKIAVNSQLNPLFVDSDSFLVYVYDQLLMEISISPDSIKLRPGETHKFSVTGFDSLGQTLEVPVIWTATGGTIDTTGLYTAGNVTGMFEVTATDPISGMTATAVVEIVPDTPVEDNRTNRMPTHFGLGQNHPNPFNPETTISFSVKEPCHVVLKVYDIRGREIMTLVDELRAPGFYRVTFDARNLPTGLYIYAIQMKDFYDVKKMLLLE